MALLRSDEGKLILSKRVEPVILEELAETE